MPKWNEDMRVKIPATIQFLRLGYEYQSLKDINIDTNTRIIINRFKPSIEKINNRLFTDAEIEMLINEILETIKNNDLGKSFFEWLQGNDTNKVKLIDFDNIDNNNFAIIDELPFGTEEKGSFRPDITILINGIPLAFLEVKKPNNEGGIQAEFTRMLDNRLKKIEHKKYFNLLQIVSFSNNMEYEDDDDLDPQNVKAGSFYTTPNGFNTSFSFLREENNNIVPLNEIATKEIKYILKDNGYSPTEFDTVEFQTNLNSITPCNKFVTSLFSKERFLFFIHYGITYVDGQIPQKHIMRYPQFFASQAMLNRIKTGGKSGVIWHTQGSGKTGLSAFSVRILKDYFAKNNITARFYYVVDRLELLTQVSGEMSNRGLSVINVNSKKEFETELNRPLSKNTQMKSNGEITVVNIQKFSDEMPTAKNYYDAKIQRIFFIDEAHRSYKMTGEFFKNLMIVDNNAIYIAMTGTPLLSTKERSNLKFGDYIHKYFYDKSIADGYTLRIKKESIGTKERTILKKNLDIENTTISKSIITDSDDYVKALCSFIENDFDNFRLINLDDTIGGMIVCNSNPQAKKVKEWFDNNSKFTTGLVISDDDIPSALNKKTQLAFKYTYKPDILIVHLMLTTGYDVSRLKKMYLLRNAKEQNLLQTISRVNRPYKSPNGKVYKFGYIVDFVDIEQEYDRTIELYLKELEEDFNENCDDTNSLSGLIIGPDDINNKYIKYKSELNNIIETKNLEEFSKGLTKFPKDTILAIKRLLNNIKNCYNEFMISRATDYAKQINIELTRKLLNETQNRIDFMNLKSQPTDLLSVVSNKDIVQIIYEFFKIKVSIMDMQELVEKEKSFSTNSDYQKLKQIINDIQNEIKNNKNKNQKEMLKLDDILKKIFSKLEIESIDELPQINEELEIVLKSVKQINYENEELSKKFDGNFAYVKTFTDATEVHPEIDKNDMAKLVDIVYKASRNIQDNNLLILQGRDSFAASLKKATTAELLKSGLYKKLNLKEWYTSLLYETYANLKIF